MFLKADVRFISTMSDLVEMISNSGKANLLIFAKGGEL